MELLMSKGMSRSEIMRMTDIEFQMTVDAFYEEDDAPRVPAPIRREPPQRRHSNDFGNGVPVSRSEDKIILGADYNVFEEAYDIMLL